MLSNILDAPVHAWMDAGNDPQHVVLSSRIRLARNWKGIPFPHMDREEALEQSAKQMRNAVSEVSKAIGRELGTLQLEQLSPLERAVLVEKHLISPMLSDHPTSRSLVVSEDASVAIMVNEEDHLRIQVMRGGLDLEGAYQEAKTIDDAIEARYDVAFSERYGYLTACPTNVGTGLRASVMVHLPALTLTKRINRIVRGIIQLGYTVRGLYGEGSSALGDVFQISNQVTMGISEEETIRQLTHVVHQLVKEELHCRELLQEQDPIGLEDRVYRAYGILTNARRLTGDEALTYLSELQLGIDMGIIPDMPQGAFHAMLVITRPHFLQKYAGREEISAAERDRLRAQVVRDRLQ